MQKKPLTITTTKSEDRGSPGPNLSLFTYISGRIILVSTKDYSNIIIFSIKALPSWEEERIYTLWRNKWNTIRLWVFHGQSERHERENRNQLFLRKNE